MQQRIAQVGQQITQVDQRLVFVDQQITQVGQRLVFVDQQFVLSQQLTLEQQKQGGE